MHGKGFTVSFILLFMVFGASGVLVGMIPPFFVQYQIFSFQRSVIKDKLALNINSLFVDILVANVLSHVNSMCVPT